MAHRLNTLQECDVILEIKDKKVLLKEDKRFNNFFLLLTLIKIKLIAKSRKTILDKASVSSNKPRKMKYKVK